MSNLRKLGLVLVAACGALQSVGLWAAGLQVAPISLTLDSKRSADGIWLSNTGDAPLHAQVRVFHWTQANGEDQLAPSRGLVVSPPMLQLAPGARQLVRVIRTGAAPQANEDAFRLLVDEIPDEAAQRTGLNFVLRYSVPVFVAPVGTTTLAPQLVWSLRGEAGAPSLEVANSGSQHAQLSTLAFIGADQKTVSISDGLLGYVLPGASMRWPLKDTAATWRDGGRLTARINGEALAQPVALAAPRP